MAAKRRHNETSDAIESATTVLFVDDEPAILEMYELLCGSECTVLTADTGSAALEKLDSSVDIVFTDRRMPDASGESLAQAIRDSPHQPTVGMLSAVQPDADLATEFEVYLTKPVSREDLHDAIEECTD